MENEKLFCHQCGAEFDPKLARYCSQCGAGFYPSKNKKRARLLDDIKEIMDEPPPYQTLRFASAVISALGWGIIVVGWFIAFTLGAMYGENIVTMEGVEGEIIQNRSWLIVGVTGVLSTVIGLFQIASGQVFMALLDIRNDTHTAMILNVRLGLALHEKQEPPAA